MEKEIKQALINWIEEKEWFEEKLDGHLIVDTEPLKHYIKEHLFKDICTCQFKEASKYIKKGLVHNKNCPLAK